MVATSDEKPSSRSAAARWRPDPRPERDVERATVEGQLRHAERPEGIRPLTTSIAHDFNNLLAATSCTEAHRW
jgi:hypothetical protein